MFDLKMIIRMENHAIGEFLKTHQKKHDEIISKVFEVRDDYILVSINTTNKSIIYKCGVKSCGKKVWCKEYVGLKHS